MGCKKGHGARNLSLAEKKSFCTVTGLVPEVFRICKRNFLFSCLEMQESMFINKLRQQLRLISGTHDHGVHKVAAKQEMYL